MWIIAIIFVVLTFLSALIIGGPGRPDALYNDPVVLQTRHEFEDGYELGRAFEAREGFKLCPSFAGRSEAWVEGFQAGRIDEGEDQFAWSWTSWDNSRVKAAVYQDRQEKVSPSTVTGGV